MFSMWSKETNGLLDYQAGSQLIKVCGTNSGRKGYAIVRNMNLLSIFSVLELDKNCKHGKLKGFLTGK